MLIHWTICSVFKSWFITYRQIPFWCFDFLGFWFIITDVRSRVRAFDFCRICPRDIWKDHKSLFRSLEQHESKLTIVSAQEFLSMHNIQNGEGWPWGENAKMCINIHTYGEPAAWIFLSLQKSPKTNATRIIFMLFNSYQSSDLWYKKIISAVTQRY